MENLLVNYPVYVVLAIVLIIWTGISILLFKVDSKLNRLEQKIKNIKEIKTENEQ